MVFLKRVKNCTFFVFESLFFLEPNVSHPVKYVMRRPEHVYIVDSSVKYFVAQ
jgi:hypothetical protein